MVENKFYILYDNTANYTMQNFINWNNIQKNVERKVNGTATSITTTLQT